jgi:hypothetical protein
MNTINIILIVIWAAITLILFFVGGFIAGFLSGISYKKNKALKKIEEAAKGLYGEAFKKPKS